MKKKLSIWANCVVNNEENFLYFAVMSVAKFVDKILIYDTGSTDDTVKVIKKLQSELGEKIIFQEIGEMNLNQFTKVRQEMLDRSKSDWILILDGDEVWWEESIKKVIKEIQNKGDKIEGIVVPMLVPVGDIYHLQEERAGQYQILGRKGHLSLKLFSKNIPGLHVDLPYGHEGFFDLENKPIQEREKLIFMDAPFLHLTHLKRSGKRRIYEKVKLELGEKVNEEFKFPEVFYQPYPSFISSPFIKMSKLDFLKSSVLTPLRKVKRRII